MVIVRKGTGGLRNFNKIVKNRNTKPRKLELGEAGREEGEREVFLRAKWV